MSVVLSVRLTEIVNGLMKNHQTETVARAKLPCDQGFREESARNRILLGG